MELQFYHKHFYTVCGYEVGEMILLQAYLCTYSLLRDGESVVTLKVLPLSSYALSITILPQLETFLELLLWNTFQCLRHISLCLQYLEIFVPIRLTLFWKQPEVIRRQNRGIGWMFHFSNRFLARNCLTKRALFA
jgi:hypothetical protein